MSLQGRRIVITGASSGIGAATARAVAAEGAAVGLIARRAELLDELAAELKAAGTDAVTASVDITDADAARAAVADLADSLGGIDGLVNNAGNLAAGRQADIDLDAVRTMYDVNVHGLLAVTQAALPYLTAEGHADVINVSSMSGRRIASAELAIYASTKFAVHALTEGLRLELTGTPVRATTIAPGFVDTPLAEDLAGDYGEMFRENLRSGMQPASIAASIVHALAAPPEMELVEIAMLPAQ